MKKLAILLAGLTLLLAACVPTGESPAVSSAEPPPAYVPPAPPPAETPPMTFTHEKFDAGETDNPRRYPETTLELIPRDDYGELYPYPGGIQPNEYYGGYSLYGFCSADGVIVTDPAFTTINRYEYEGKTCYTFRRSYGLGWENRISNTVYLAATDGRFVLAFDEVRDAHEGAFAVRTGDKWGAVDYEGNELLPCVYEHAMFFGEGLAAVSPDFDEGYQYVDRQGNTVFSMPPAPRDRIEHFDEWGLDAMYRYFYDLTAFQDGRALFWSPEGYYGYIDRTGAVVIEVKYGEPDPSMLWFNGAGKFYHGTAVVSDWKRTYVIDRDGAEVTTVGPAVTMRYGDLFLRQVAGKLDQWNQPETEYVDVNGQPFPDGEAYLRTWFGPDEESFSKNDRFGYRKADGTVLLAPAYDGGVERMGDCFVVRQGQYGGLVTGDGIWIVKRFMPPGADGD